MTGGEDLRIFTGPDAMGNGTVSNFDTELFLFEINPDGTFGALVAANDDGGAPGGVSFDSQFTVSALAAGSYILVAGPWPLEEAEARTGIDNDNDFGDFQITIEGAARADEIASGPLAPADILGALPTLTIGTSGDDTLTGTCLLYTSPSPRDKRQSRMPSSA